MPSPSAPHELVVLLTQRLHAFFSDLDERRYDHVVSLFLPDGRWLRQGRWLEGRSAVRAALEARPASMKVRHVITNVVVHADGREAAEAQVDAYMTAYRQLEGGAPSLFRLNLVSNVFRQHGGEWLLAEQQLLPEFDFPQPSAGPAR